MVNITGTDAVTVAKAADGIFLQVNAALTGTYTIAGTGSTQYGTGATTIATITNPAVGSQYRYGGLRSLGPITVTASGAGNATVTVVNHIT